MRPFALLVLGLAVGCGPTRRVVRPEPAPPPSVPAPAPPKPVVVGPPPGCPVAVRTVSVPGRGGVHPSVAFANGAYAVVWEETASDHRGIHFQTLDAEARPLSPSVEVADLDRGGAEPRVVADGDGFAVVWTVDEPDTSTISFRRLDARGRPLGDVVPVVTVPHARALAFAKTAGGFALGWWTWSADPPQQNLTWLDADGRPRGRAVRVVSGLLVEPAMDLLADGAGVQAAWVETVDGADHVFSGRIARAGIEGRADLGPGDAPAIADGGVVFARPGDATVWRAQPGAPPARLADGQAPAASDRRLCLYDNVPAGESSFDELRCFELTGGGTAREQRVARAPGGVLTLELSAPPDGNGLGVVYQTLAGDDMQVAFAALDCARKLP